MSIVFMNGYLESKGAYVHLNSTKRTHFEVHFNKSICILQFIESKVIYVVNLYS